ncbi:MAG TPA: right-handed parallel beta-helix repeat-containing protein [Thermoanaerobaculia bacterium]|nr:right-handed parallel beta-helix repeat-containing protein [Thermoanaerobaculia bacterium]
MSTSRLSMTMLAVALVALAIVPAAQAQATRTWVSGVGDDVNPCSRTAPCKTFAGAISKTAAGGEISVLDPGGFGGVTITKSITINGDGTLAGILAALTNGIIVNAGANDKVVIRNVSINGANSGFDGIRYLAGGQLTLENVTIKGFQANVNSQAVDVSLVASGKLFVKDTTITNCEAGIRLTSTGGTLQASLDNVRIENVDGQAFEAVAGSTLATIKHSNFSGNGLAGVRAAGIGAVINVEDTVLAFNTVGVNAAVSGSRIRISDTTIVNNATGITFVGGATVESAGNNRVAGNTATTAPNGTYTVE